MVRSSLWGSMMLTERIESVHPILSYIKQKRRFSFLLNFSQLIHRDLAARNVLLGDKLQCKITDFGMARDLGLGDGIYARKSNVSSDGRDITRSNKNLLCIIYLFEWKSIISWFVPFSDMDSDIRFYLTDQLTEQSQMLENFKFYTFSERIGMKWLIGKSNFLPRIKAGNLQIKVL